ncbi:MAG: Ig-like domain-containing protein [Muribaculaceae bacterium]|nr:Ig-like domain-containing protein [Muribaculaceae bacterium]
MKRSGLSRTIVAIAMMLIGWLPSLAHDFEVNGIFYNKTSDNTAAVTYKGDSYKSYFNEYSGDIVIPSSVDYNGATYSVTSIGEGVFYLCESLTSIEIPNSVTSIGVCAFIGCSSLTSIVVDSGNSIYDSRNDCNAIIETASNTLVAGCQNTIIPNSVTSIENDAFSSCESLTSIEIPNSVTSIGDYAFSQCSSLTSIEIPNSVTRIGNYAFYLCESLTKITCLATNPPTIKSKTFSYYSAELYVPSGCKSAYQSANYWKSFNIKELPIILSTSIVLNKTSASLKATETLTLVATVLPENATDKSVTWKSSNEAVATVDANGKVTAVAVGEATITATTADGSNLSASCKVTVTSTLATSITLDYTEYEIVEKSDFQLTATILPESTTNKGVVWSSSDMRIASVDENGLVRAYSVGEAVITATTIDGSNLSASCKVTVVSSLAQSITLDKTEVSLKATETATLVATVLPELTTDKSVEWSSSDKSVATIDANGLVTAIAVGEATITATTADGSNLSASCTVTVVPTLAESIALDKTEISLEATETATLVATVLPELTTDKSVEWSSSDESVAVVDDNGVVTAIAVGEATITATTTDGSNLSASCKVVVKPTLATSIT